MKDPYAVLSSKRAEISRLRREINALRLVIELLDQESDALGSPASGFGELPSIYFQTGVES